MNTGASPGSFTTYQTESRSLQEAVWTLHRRSGDAGNATNRLEKH